MDNVSCMAGLVCNITCLELNRGIAHAIRGDFKILKGKTNAMFFPFSLGIIEIFGLTAAMDSPNKILFSKVIARPSREIEILIRNT